MQTPGKILAISDSLFTSWRTVCFITYYNIYHFLDIKIKCDIKKVMPVDELILTAKPEVTRKRGEDGYRTFSIRIKEETVEKLDALAAKTGRTRNELIGIFLAYSADNCIVKE